MAQQLRSQMLKVTLNFFGSQDDAEDAAQEAMLQLWHYCEHIDAERNVEALAVRVAKNCCVSMYRKQQRHTSDVNIDTRPLRQMEGDESPQQQLEAKDLQRMLTEVVAQLKPRERQLFEMRQTDGLSTEEIAKQTGIPKASVTVMVSTARKKVFTELKRRMKQ
ncbi:MAG: sigma-70 family RNA polymerase sigma factor [Prevotella sp.]|jgi:RNA polymerase sigma factor (sigma-70 family)|nr:sigma-70 family RNA polymerase sigma factor [Prevotella sp.]